MTENRYLSLRQVQAELGLHADELDPLIRSGRLPAFRIAGHWRVDRLMLERLVDDLTSECQQLLRQDRPAATIPHQRNGHRTDDPPPNHTGALGLTEQQHRIVRLIGEGMSNAEVADSLSVEVSTVKSHVSRVLLRLNLRDREQLIAHAWRSGAMDGHV